MAEATTGALQGAYADDPVMLVWWGTEVECASAIARLERDGDLSEDAGQQAFARLDELTTEWHEIQPSDGIRNTARRLVRVHDLRAADALQLAAAIAGSEGTPSSLTVASLDGRLNAAARREGFSVVGA